MSVTPEVEWEVLGMFTVLPIQHSKENNHKYVCKWPALGARTIFTTIQSYVATAKDRGLLICDDAITTLNEALK